MRPTPHCIRLRSGLFFDPFNPTPEMMAALSWYDISWGLVHQPRFMGHLQYQVSVGDHSLRAHQIAERLCEHYGVRDRAVPHAALLHDASEAILGDIPTPFKTHPSFAAVAAVETWLQGLINVRFGLEADAHHHPIVKEADAFALALEAWMGNGVDVRDWGKEIPAHWKTLRGGFVKPPTGDWINHLGRLLDLGDYYGIGGARPPYKQFAQTLPPWLV